MPSRSQGSRSIRRRRNAAADSLRSAGSSRRNADARAAAPNSRTGAARHAEQQRLRALQRDLVAAEFFDQIQAEVDRGIDAAAAEEPAVFGHELVGLPEHLRIALPQNVGDGPVRGRLPAVEQAALGEEATPRADARHVGAARVPLPQPGQQRRVPRDPSSTSRPDAGEDDDVGLLDVVDRAVRRQAERQRLVTLRPSIEAARTRKRGCVLRRGASSRARRRSGRLRAVRSPSRQSRLPAEPP